MIDLSPLVRRLAGTPLAEWSQGLQAQLDAKLEKAMATSNVGKRRSMPCPRSPPSTSTCSTVCAWTATASLPRVNRCARH